MTKTCTHCTSPFELTQTDLEFYEKVSPIIGNKKLSLPSPSLCPTCREQRRMAFRNERKLYNRRCDLTQKQIISLYAPDSDTKVYETSEWWSDKWDALEYGRDFDFSRSFFEQFQELQRVVPRMSLNTVQNENSDFTSFAGYNKNCYLIHTADQNEDCYYGVYALRNKNSVDFMFIYDCELCYEIRDAQKCYRVLWGQNIANCYDSYFIEDCIGCHDCIMCIGLRNQNFCFKNQQYNEAEYKKLKNDFLKDLCTQVDSYKKEFAALRLQFPHPAVHITNSENCTGDFIQNSSNLSTCFDISKAQNCKYCSFIEDCKDSYDWTFYSDKGELGYELASVANNVYHCLFSMNCWGRSTDLLYCDLCQFCRDCFGCVGLKRKQYCILNKQYTKERYEELLAKIIQHMRNPTLDTIRGNTGPEWGEFFPMVLSPFAYNETIAQEYYPLTKEKVAEYNLYWRDTEIYNRYEGSKTVPPKDINQVKDELTKEILTCINCAKNYRIIQQELHFYRDIQIPVPDMCFNCRHQNRLKARNPRVLYDRNCTECKTALKTTYAPDRPEPIYCEMCYLNKS